MASRILETLEFIEHGRQNCIKNAKLANLETSDNMSIYDIGELFLQKNTPEFISPNTPWERPSDWWDCQTILDGAEDRVDDNGNTVYPAYIILMDDSDLTTTFSKTATNQALQGDAYLTSDGVWYGSSVATHTWDLEQDKECSDGYKTRYVIVYVLNKNSTVNINLRDFSCIEVISKNNIKNNFIFGSNSSPYNAKIISVNLPNVTSVGNTIFQFCYSLQSVSLPNVTSIGNNVFQNCYSLQSISLPNVTSIGKTAFSSCYPLQSVSLPNVTSIGDSAFYYCYSLQSVSLPNVTSIGNNVFQYCSSLQSVSLPNVKSIGNYIFHNCYSLQSVILPNVTSIGNYIFYNCYSLLKIELPSTIQTIPTTKNSFGEYLKQIILPNDFDLNINLTGETSLTHSAIVDILNKLKDLTGDTSKTITLGVKNLAKITDADKEIATNKNWTIA